MGTKNNLEIIVRIIQMRPPIIMADSSTKRNPVIHDPITEAIISKESFLRTLAYKNTTIKTDNAFFDDSDMKSEYYLLVIYDRISNTPLLSTRYYFDKSIIEKTLKGDNSAESERSLLNEKFSLNTYKDGSIFLADRLSGNIGSSIYRQYRNCIFSLFYSEITKNNKNCSLLLMVRKEKKDKQLLKYIKMGFILIGSTLHNGKEHSIILGDLNKYAM